MRKTVVAVAVAAALTTAGVTAVASTPSSGKVGKSAPTAKWAGENTSGGVTGRQWDSNPDAACSAPTCDTYALDVLDAGGDLNLKVNLQVDGTGGDGTVYVRITDPSGKVTVLSGDSSPATTFKASVKGAAAGTYTIDITDAFLCCGATPYTAQADLVFPVAAAPAPTTPTPTTPTGPAPAPSATTMTAKAPTVSAKKANKAKKLAVTLTSNGPVSKVRVVLVKGSKQLGAATLASLSGTKKVTVKFKGKLKPGTYGFAAGGTDAAGKPVQTGVKFKVKK